MLQTRHLAVFLCLLAGCAVSFDPIGAGGDPFGDSTPEPEVTPAPPVVVTVGSAQVPLRQPDGGFIATNDGRSWSELEALTDGEVFGLASAVEVVGTLAEWLEPGDGADASAAATGTLAGYVAEAIANERYAAIRITAEGPEDLPSAWPTTTDPPGFVPDGVISLLEYGDAPGDDDDSAGDDDDSAGDDDDSAGDDDDASRNDEDSVDGGSRDVVQYVDWSDPDFFQLHGAVVQALGDRFADGPGLAFVTVGGAGAEGMWRLPDEVGPVGNGLFTEATWFSTVGLYTELYRGAFDDVPAHIAWTVVRDAGVNAEALRGTLDGDDVAFRDGCFGGCQEFDWDRFPGESGEPYPSEEPFGGWLPGGSGVGLVAGGGLGGVGGWRRAEESGSWDDAVFGTVTQHLDRALTVAQAHAELRWMSLGDTACLSAWAVAAAPSGSSCDEQAGEWSELAKWTWSSEDRRAVGARVELRTVSLPGNWVELGQFDLELELVNAGMATAEPRPWEVRFVDLGGSVVAEATVNVGALDGGESTERVVAIALDGAVPSGDVQIEVRVPETRAFGGRMPLALPEAGEGWSVGAVVVAP
ncbi:MAG: hypothetical protein KDA24_13115 [Deltaproteobacteria bacterium]|nr:hypothetical protein [Deltaproteobacteria bacterium]